jgi:hypothetical protein
MVEPPQAHDQTEGSTPLTPDAVVRRVFDEIQWGHLLAFSGHRMSSAFLRHTRGQPTPCATHVDIKTIQEELDSCPLVD